MENSNENNRNRAEFPAELSYLEDLKSVVCRTAENQGINLIKRLTDQQKYTWENGYNIFTFE